MSNDITISAIPPLAEPAHVLAMIHCLNVHFQAIAADMSVKFVTNDEHFYLKNGQMNNRYFHDSAHFTVNGSNKLAKTLGLLNVVNGKKRMVFAVTNQCRINASSTKSTVTTMIILIRHFGIVSNKNQDRKIVVAVWFNVTNPHSVPVSRHPIMPQSSPYLNTVFRWDRGVARDRCTAIRTGNIGRHRALKPKGQNQLASVGTKRQGFQPSMNSHILSENPQSRGGQGHFAPTGYSQYRTPPGQRGHPLHPAPGRSGHPAPSAEHRNASVHSGANARTPMQHCGALGANQRPTAQHQYGPERSRPEFRHNDQLKKKSYADQLRRNDRCTFCGEGNHR